MLSQQKNRPVYWPLYRVLHYSSYIKCESCVLCCFHSIPFVLNSCRRNLSVPQNVFTVTVLASDNKSTRIPFLTQKPKAMRMCMATVYDYCFLWIIVKNTSVIIVCNSYIMKHWSEQRLSSVLAHIKECLSLFDHCEHQSLLRNHKSLLEFCWVIMSP